MVDADRAVFGFGLVLAIAAALLWQCGCSPVAVQVVLERDGQGERATVEVDGVPAVVLSSATTLTVREP